MTTDFTIERLSEDALLLRFGDSIDVATNARVHVAARVLRAAALPGVVDIAPAYASLLLRFETGSETGPGSLSSLSALRSIIEAESEPDPVSAVSVEIPVCYGGGYGPDLEAVAAHAHMTPQEVIARHAAAEYTVAMLGFAPGFPYLLGLDPALHVPRRTTPRTRVPAGAVAIGGAQTGIYPCELPGGWNLLGRTPLALFDQQHNPPCLLAPGDRVRFRVIGDAEFAMVREKYGQGALGHRWRVRPPSDGPDRG